MNHIARLCFADGAERDVSVPDGVSLLEAALTEGVNLQHQCMSGSCGSCIARLSQGEVSQKAGRVIGLLPFELEEGLRLSCTSVPRSDTVWQFDYPGSALDDIQTTRTPASVKGIKRVSASVVELTLRLDGEFNFTPGQYVRLNLPDGTARSISLASTPDDLPNVTFLIRLVPGGLLSAYLDRDCAEGDIIYVEGPFGKFALSGGGPAIFIAGGTGLGPILSMIDESRNAGRARCPMLLCFGISKEDDFFYREEFDLRRQWMPNLSVRLACDDLADSARLDGVIKGSVISLLKTEDILPNTKAYICGPPAMVVAASARLQDLGVPPDHIITERFNPS